MPLNRLDKAAERRPEQDADAIIFIEAILVTRVGNRFARRCERVERRASHAPRVFGIHILGRIEFFQFARNPRPVTRGVEARHRSDAGFAFEQIAPEFFRVQAKRGHRADSGDDDTRFFRARLHLQLGQRRGSQAMVNDGFNRHHRNRVGYCERVGRCDDAGITL